MYDAIQARAEREETEATPVGRGVRREDALQRRTIDCYDVSLTAPAVQLRRMDEALVAVREAVVPGWSRGVQLRGDGGGAASVHEAAAEGVRGGGGTIPYLQTIQQAFGRHDVGGVQAHVGGAAKDACASIGAEAYATGDHVAFRGAPTLHTAAHEAAHVVQQRAGVSLKGGVGESGDVYERHADEVADAVVAGQSAEGILDRMAGGGGGSAVQSKAVQRVDDPEAKEPEEETEPEPEPEEKEPEPEAKADDEEKADTEDDSDGSAGDGTEKEDEGEAEGAPPTPTDAGEAGASGQDAGGASPAPSSKEEDKADSGSGPDPSSAKGDIVYKNGGFRPYQVEVSKGGSVTFANQDANEELERIIFWRPLSDGERVAEGGIGPIAPGGTATKTLSQPGRHPFSKRDEDPAGAIEVLGDPEGPFVLKHHGGTTEFKKGESASVQFADSTWNASPSFSVSIPVVGWLVQGVVSGELDMATAFKLWATSSSAVVTRDQQHIMLKAPAPEFRTADLSATGTLRAGVKLDLLIQELKGGLGVSLTVKSQPKPKGGSTSVRFKRQPDGVYAIDSWTMNAPVSAPLEFSGSGFAWYKAEGMVDAHGEYDLFKGRLGTIEKDLQVNATGNATELLTLNGLDIQQLITIYNVIKGNWSTIKTAGSAALGLANKVF